MEPVKVSEDELYGRISGLAIDGFRDEWRSLSEAAGELMRRGQAPSGRKHVRPALMHLSSPISSRNSSRPLPRPHSSMSPIDELPEVQAGYLRTSTNSLQHPIRRPGSVTRFITAWNDVRCLPLEPKAYCPSS